MLASGAVKGYAKPLVDRRLTERGWDTTADAFLATCDTIVTRIARDGLGLATRRDLRPALALTYLRNAADVTRSKQLRGLFALALAAVGQWDHLLAVAGGTFPTKLRASQTFGATNLDGLAKALAAAARAGMPPAQVQGAIMRIRDLAERGELEPRIAILAGRCFFEQVALASDTPTALKRWLETGEVAFESTGRGAAVADGEDVRVKIFERYSAELSDDELEFARAGLGNIRGRGSDLAAGFALMLFVSGAKLPASWNKAVDADLARWLGATANPKPHLATLRALTERYRQRPAEARSKQNLDGLFDAAIYALRLADDPVLATVGRGSAEPFVPGRFFHDDPFALVRYLRAAEKARAKPEDVMPAWLDFLSRRSPRKNQVFIGGILRWSHLAVVQHVITERLGGGKPAAVGPALRASLQLA